MDKSNTIKKSSGAAPPESVTATIVADIAAQKPSDNEKAMTLAIQVQRPV